MIVLVFLALSALRIWSWRRAAPLFIACLIAAGVTAPDNLLLVPIFWQGAAWTGYLLYGSSSASLVLWQLVTDCVLFGIILFLGIETGHRVSGFFPSSAVPEYHLLPEVKVLLFLLGAAAYFIKALLWVQLPQSMTGKTPAPVDSYIIRAFSLSTAIVSAYQTMRLTSLFWPDAAGRGALVAAAASLGLVYIIPHLSKKLPPTKIKVTPFQALLSGTRLLYRWDDTIGVEIGSFAVSSLSTLGQSCLWFEEQLRGALGGFIRLLTILPHAPRKLYGRFTNSKAN